MWLLISLAAIGVSFSERGAHGSGWAMGCAQIGAIPMLLCVAYAVFLRKWSFRLAASSAGIALLAASLIQWCKHSLIASHAVGVFTVGVMNPAGAERIHFREISGWVALVILAKELLKIMPVIALSCFGAVRGPAAGMLAGFMSGLVFGCFGVAFGTLGNIGLYEDVAGMDGRFAGMSFIVYQCAFSALQQALWTAIASYFFAEKRENSGFAARLIPGLALAGLLHFANYVLLDYEWISGLATIVLFSVLYASACESGEGAPLPAQGMEREEPKGFAR